MSEPIRLTTPLTQDKVRSLHIGDRVLISGTIYAARDAAHKRMVETLDRGEPLPVDLRDQIVYYVGPSPAKPGQAIGSAGPTTSGRMDAYAPRLMEKGLSGMIGKGNRSQAVKDAQINADLNHIKNIQFVNEDAGDFLVRYAEGGRADVVIMDPPRSGSTPEFLRSLLQMKPKRIVYISCNPETQVRDVRVLQKGGYKVEACEGYDMFPHTVHVETVVGLHRKDM